MRLRPARELACPVLPTRDGGLVAPAGELRHDGAMGPGVAIGAQARLVLPDAHGPEGQAAVDQELAAPEAGGLAKLPDRALVQEKEVRQEAQRAQAQAGGRD